MSFSKTPDLELTDQKQFSVDHQIDAIDALQGEVKWDDSSDSPLTNLFILPLQEQEQLQLLTDIKKNNSLNIYLKILGLGIIGAGRFFDNDVI